MEGKTSLTDHFYHKAKNMIYGMKIAMNKTNSLHITNISNRITILGIEFFVPESDKNNTKAIESIDQKLNEFIANICWFSYRRGFKQIIVEHKDRNKDNKKKKDIVINCDTGWGCMLRCGQMMLFEVLQKVNTNTRFEVLLDMFSENSGNELAPFSIRNIVRSAYEEFDL